MFVYSKASPKGLNSLMSLFCRISEECGLVFTSERCLVYSLPLVCSALAPLPEHTLPFSWRSALEKQHKVVGVAAKPCTL